MEPIETDRLLIRRFTPDDWWALQALAVQYQASPYAKYEDPWPTSAEAVRAMAESFASGDDYLAVCLRQTGELIGLLAVERRRDQERRVHNLGYVFRPDHGGHGYATEACREAMAYLFRRLAADGILAGTNPANDRSVRLLRRLGLTEQDAGEFSLSREEWTALGAAPKPDAEM